MQLLWLGSQEASFMNGEVVIIDGGVDITGSNYGQYIQQAELADTLLQSKE